MKQTIEIEVPDGKVAVWEDGKLMFKDTKTPLPKTWLEFVKTQNYENTQIIEGVLKDASKQYIALIQLHKLRDCYRQGWIPDWTCIQQAGGNLPQNHGTFRDSGFV